MKKADKFYSITRENLGGSEASGRCTISGIFLEKFHQPVDETYNLVTKTDSRSPENSRNFQQSIPTLPSTHHLPDTSVKLPTTSINSVSTTLQHHPITLTQTLKTSPLCSTFQVPLSSLDSDLLYFCKNKQKI
jgi:hypothetical protein